MEYEATYSPRIRALWNRYNYTEKHKDIDYNVLMRQIKARINEINNKTSQEEMYLLRKELPIINESQFSFNRTKGGKETFALRLHYLREAFEREQNVFR